MRREVDICSEYCRSSLKNRGNIDFFCNYMFIFLFIWWGEEEKIVYVVKDMGKVSYLLYLFLKNYIKEWLI